MRQSILEMAGLPPPFGITLLGLGLILTLSPYLGGADFGLFKVPTFSPGSQNRLRIFGPLALIAAISLHVPGFLKTSPAVMAPPAESTAKPDTTAVNELFVGAITYNGDVSGIDFSPTGTLIATGGGNDHTAILWNASTGKQQRLLVGDSVVSMVAFNSDGTQLATNFRPVRCRLWRTHRFFETSSRWIRHEIQSRRQVSGDREWIRTDTRNKPGRPKYRLEPPHLKRICIFTSL